MSELRFHKLACQVICTQHDDDGEIVGEQVVGEMSLFNKHLPDVAEIVADGVRRANEQHASAAT